MLSPFASGSQEPLCTPYNTLCRSPRYTGFGAAGATNATQRINQRFVAGEKLGDFLCRGVRRRRNHAPNSRRPIWRAPCGWCRRGLGGIGRAHDLAVFRDGVLAFQDLHHHRAGGHEFHEFAEERARLVHGVEGLGLLAGSCGCASGATIRSPAFSIMALIAPVRLRAVASGLRIEKVRSIAMKLSFGFKGIDEVAGL